MTSLVQRFLIPRVRLSTELRRIFKWSKIVAINLDPKKKKSSKSLEWKSTTLFEMNLSREKWQTSCAERNATIVLNFGNVYLYRNSTIIMLLQRLRWLLFALIVSWTKLQFNEASPARDERSRVSANTFGPRSVSREKSSHLWLLLLARGYVKHTRM